MLPLPRLACSPAAWTPAAHGESARDAPRRGASVAAADQRWSPRAAFRWVYTSEKPLSASETCRQESRGECGVRVKIAPLSSACVLLAAMAAGSGAEPVAVRRVSVLVEDEHHPSIEPIFMWAAEVPHSSSPIPTDWGALRLLAARPDPDRPGAHLLELLGGSCDGMLLVRPGSALAATRAYRIEECTPGPFRSQPAIPAPDRPALQGRVTRADGWPAAGARVVVAHHRFPGTWERAIVEARKQPGVFEAMVRESDPIGTPFDGDVVWPLVARADANGEFDLQPTWDARFVPIAVCAWDDATGETAHGVEWPKRNDLPERLQLQLSPAPRLDIAICLVRQSGRPPRTVPLRPWNPDSTTEGLPHRPLELDVPSSAWVHTSIVVPRPGKRGRLGLHVGHGAPRIDVAIEGRSESGSAALWHNGATWWLEWLD